MAGGRNSSGRITVFHRGGGAKRLQRAIDLKRSTSAIGIVEKIEYDPNRSSRIAQVRWNDVPIRQRRSSPMLKMAREIISAATHKNHQGGITLSRETERSFAFASMPGKNQFATSKDVLFKAFSSPKAKKGEASSPLSLGSNSPLGFPRMAVAGAKPPFFVLRTKDDEVKGGENTYSLGEIHEWRRNSVLWAHRIKRKAALTWQMIMGRGGALERNESNLKMDQESKNDGRWKEGRAPVTYVIASHQLEPGKMVMNCDWPKPST